MRKPQRICQTSESVHQRWHDTCIIYLGLNLSFHVLRAIGDVRCVISSRVRKRTARAEKDSRSELERNAQKWECCATKAKASVSSRQSRGHGRGTVRHRIPRGHATGSVQVARGEGNPKEELNACEGTSGCADSHVLHRS